MNALILIIFVGLFVIAFIGIGAALIFYSLRSRKKAEASQAWPSTNGQITESRVAHSTSTDSEGDRSDSYSPSVRYSYQVMGQTYTGKNIGFGAQTSYNRPAKAEAALEQYPAGGVVTVYYNPEDPSDAVLARQAGGANLTLVIGIVFLVIGLSLACVGLILALFVPASGG